MACRSYRLLSGTALTAVRRALATALDGWCADWGLERVAFELSCERAWESGGRWPLWRHSRRRADAAIWFGWGDDLPAQLQRLIYPPDRSAAPQAASLAAAAAGAALQGLVDALAGLADIAPAPLLAADEDGPGPVLAYASGGVCAVLRSGRCVLHCVLNDALVAQLGGAALPPAAAPPLGRVDYRQVLAGTALRLPVSVGGAELSLGSLRTLAPGDVIRLDALADQPLRIAGPQGGALLAGYLGLAEQSVALEVLPADHTTE
ncbi:FliM/FliN family flagellar motor C-terminal domain-containing protein [Massilia sp. BJB1822]|uniref:FliM/FliN family flagellar motor C-terminal domain-containing protein n=1 Tax=Massilia sp. BJB1822 TaxID=2744470 RepID=UPI001593AFDB|nr:FliM/FliN family flagellar motor C-terminal domain-containing protein [Massilia sp. BJB1822]NVE01854.1 FliM/FliN family flagellar motor switch protein [Massilia sp. BJB1822]